MQTTNDTADYISPRSYSPSDELGAGTQAEPHATANEGDAMKKKHEPKFYCPPCGATRWRTSRKDISYQCRSCGWIGTGLLASVVQTQTALIVEPTTVDRHATYPGSV